MHQRTALSAEAFGVLRALSKLGKIRHFDAVADELAENGLARIDDVRLTITRKGRLLARVGGRVARHKRH